MGKKIRSSKDRDYLTGWEDAFLKKKLRCPDCKKGRLLKGPCGGLAQNIKCSNCGSKFNFSPPFTTQRISDPCPDKPKLRKGPLPGHNPMGVYR